MDIDTEDIIPVPTDENQGQSPVLTQAQSELNAKATSGDGRKVAGVRSQRPILIDDAHPFELEAYLSGYTDRTAIHRLLHILERSCLPPPPAPANVALAHTTFNITVQRVRAGRDVGLYQAAVGLWNNVVSPPGVEGENIPAAQEHGEKVEVDAVWMESTVSKNAQERNKLEVELKTYQSNMIKESIRMAHRDLGNFYRSIGDDAAALKHYTKSREFCTASQHVLDMCLSVLELLIELRNYAHITTYVFKAETALEAASSASQPVAQQSSAPASAPTKSTSANAGTGIGLIHKKAGGAGSSAASGKADAEREKVTTKLTVATALAHLGQSSYEKAASVFLRVGSPKALGDWNGKLLTPADIAVYGTLCALATFSRSALKAQLLENEDFAAYLEHEPYVRELLEAYMASRFHVVLELLERYSTRHLFDIHLGPHVHDLTTLIRDRALVLYFTPFASVRLARMSSAFGIQEDELERLVVGLIRAGEIKGRIDSRNKILKARVTDQRVALFARAAQAGTQMQATNRKLLLRMRLQQADLIVKAPKNQGQVMLTDAMEA